MSTSGSGRLTAIVPARNAASFLGACIDGLVGAGFKAGDIIVVDDASTDATAEIARGRGVRLLRLPLQVGAGSARNAGAAASDGNILVFVDADVVVHADAMLIIARTFAEDPACDAIFGVYCARPAHPKRVSRIRNLLHRHVHMENAGEATTFWAGLGAVRRDAFDTVEGFDPAQRMMEDVAFGLSLTCAGHRIRLLPELQGTHLKRWSWIGMARTDLIDRAIPWARLLRNPASGQHGRVLNIGPVSRLSVSCVAASLAGMLWSSIAVLTGAGSAMIWGGLALVAAAFVSLALVNRAFLSRLVEEGRTGDRLAAVPVLWVHYLCGGLGFAWARLAG